MPKIYRQNTEILFGVLKYKDIPKPWKKWQIIYTFRVPLINYNYL